MANPWFRLYSEFADDPKVQTMSETLQRRLVMLFCDRCKGPVEEAYLAFHWRIGSVELQETKAAFLERGFIDENWNVQNWEKRQYKSDSSTPRVTKYRETRVKRFKTVTVTAPEQKQNRTEQEPKGSREPDGSPPLPLANMPKSDGVRPEDYANAWNSLRGSLPKVKDFTESRRKKVQARMRDGVTVAEFREAVEMCTRTPFLFGANDRGWVASFDWLVENDRNLHKVIEGSYQTASVSPGGNYATRGSNRAQERTDANIAAAQAALDRIRMADGAAGGLG